MAKLWTVRCSDCGARARPPFHPSTGRFYRCGKTIMKDGRVDTPCGNQVGAYMMVYFHDQPEYEVVRGHVTPEQFAAVLADEGRPAGNKQLGKPVHKYMRCVPCREDEHWCDMMYHESRKGPGAFPITIAYYQD